MKRFGLAGLALLASTCVACAQVIIIDPPIPKPGGGGTSKAAGSRGGSSNSAGLGAVMCGLGAGMLAGSPHRHRGTRLGMWGIACGLGALANPAAGVVGGVAILALFDPEQGMVTKFMRPGGFRCQPIDADRVAGCRTLLKQRGVKLPPVDVNARIAMQRIATMR